VNIEQEVARIIRSEGIKHTSKQILDKVGEQLSSSGGIVLVDLRSNGDITIHYSTSEPLALYALRIAEQMLVDKRLDNVEIIEGDDDNGES